MSNIFTDLVAKLTRRQRKGKPVPVPVPPKPEPPLRAVTYNRVDGRVSGGVIQAGSINGGAVWDDEARVYRGNNYVVQQRPPYQQTPKAPVKPKRHDYDDSDYYESAFVPDPAFFFLSEERTPESPSTGSDYLGGYTDTSSGSSSPYEAPQASYSAPEPSYSAPSYSGDSGSSYSSDSGGGYSSGE